MLNSMSELLSEFGDTAIDSLQSNTLQTCSRWCKKRWIMPGTPPKPMNFDEHPWMPGMLDSTSRYNYSMKAAQMAVSSTALGVSLFTLDVKKKDVLFVLPSAGLAADFSKSRFGPILELSPYVNKMFVDCNSVGLKRTADTTLYVRGGKSPAGLKSVPVATLILDEVDEISDRSINLSLTRLDGQRPEDRLAWFISTPTFPNQGIHKLIQKSTRDHFFFKCPCCSKTTTLSWPDSFVVCGETANDPETKNSHLVCKECKKPLDHKAKSDWLGKGFWESTNKDSDPDHRGFEINQMYSFMVDPAILAEFYLRGLQDDIAMMEFYNSRLGLPYAGEGAKVNDEQIDDCIRLHSTSDIRVKNPEKVITMGVDQGKSYYAEICEWDINASEWCRGINHVAKPKVIGIQKFNEFDREQELGRLMREFNVWMCVIDADPHRVDASKFALAFPGHVTLCQYRSGVKGREMKADEYTEGAPIVTVDRTSWLSTSLTRFKTGSIALPADVGLEYREHIKSMARHYEKDADGNTIMKYINDGADHFAHARNYSEIALPLVGARETNQDISEFI